MAKGKPAAKDSGHGQPMVDVLNNMQQAALYFSRKRRRMAAAKITTRPDSPSVVAGSANGTVVCSLSMVPQFGQTVWAMTDTAGGRFGLSGNNIVVANSTLLTTGTQNVGIEAKDPTGRVFTATIPIAITAA